ncbi:MAG: response regulator transcription factor [Clostridiales bacterium]|nr:response regulator transcription factor [Clostridiales bacterium]
MTDSNIKILIAEDDVALRTITSAYFTKNGFEVDQAGNGDDACRLVMNNHYDAIILDIMMPGKDGKEVCKFIRTRYDVPVIFLTALGQETDIIEGYEIGADEYLTKPYSTKLLLLKVNALIKRYRGLLVKDGRIEVGEITIEPARRLVSVNGRRTELTPREYELLLYFVENRDQALTRNQILDAVWGRDFEGYDRAVDTYIKKLRASLGEASYHIETVIKHGYMWKNGR